MAAPLAPLLSRRALTVVVVGLLAAVPCLLWLIASPLSSGADEPAHVLRAASLAEGVLLGERTSRDPDEPRLRVDVPASAARLPEPACFARRPEVPASCEAGTIGRVGPDGEAIGITSSGRHPPFYYALAGLPFLADLGETSAYLSRGVSAAVCAGFLAAALLLALRQRSALAVAGVLAATPPMALHLTGVVNPNGVEAFAALALWTALLVLVAGPAGRTGGSPNGPAGGPGRPDAGALPRAAVHVAGTAGLVLLVTRQLGPVWLGLILLSVAAVADARAVHALAADRAVRGYAAAGMLAGAAAAAWLLLVGNPLLPGPQPEPAPLSLPSAFLLSLSETPVRLEQLVGQFGWLDVLLPPQVWRAWPAAVGVLAVLAAAAVRARRDDSRMRRRLALLAGLALAAIVVPAALEAWRYNELGLVWQGRYTLPLAAGIPVVAGFTAAAAPSRVRRVLEPVGVPLVAVILVVHGLAFFFALRRYAAGTAAQLDFLEVVAWQPPVHAATLLGAFAAWQVAAGLAFLAVWRRAQRGLPTDLPDRSGPAAVPVPAAPSR